MSAPSYLLKSRHGVYYFRIRNAGFAEKNSGRPCKEIKLIPYDGDTAWVEPKLIDARRCLEADSPPPAAVDCEWCEYVSDAASV